MDIALIEECSISVATETVQQVIAVESNNNPIALGVNLGNGLQLDFQKPTTIEQAISLAELYMQQGLSVDIGYMQVNSQHLKTFNITIAQLFDPCINIKAGTTVLFDAYNLALKHYNQEDKALFAALSIYNTGNMEDGFKNGYVQKYISTEHVSALYESDSAIPLDKYFNHLNKDEKK